MKKIIIALIALFILVPNIYAKTTIYETKNATETCNAIGKNELKIYVYDNVKKESTRVGKKENSTGCSNTTYYNENLSTVTTNEYEPWVWTGRVDSTATFYKEGVIQQKSDYQHVIISNKSQSFDSSGVLKRHTTLRPTEKIYLDIDFSNKIVNKNTYKDLRITINNGCTSGDNDIIKTDSIAYYIYGSDNKTYGPYNLEKSILKDIIYQTTDNVTYNQVLEYTLISENLLKDIPNNINVTGIKIVPFEHYNVHNGYFRMYNINITAYEENQNYKEDTLPLTNANNIVREAIVDDMFLNASIKWDVSPTSYPLHFYHHYNKTARIFQSGEVYYGIPYVNQINTTIEAFTSQTTKNNKTDNAYFSYNFPKKYLADTTSTIGNPIIKDTPITNPLYVYETHEKNDTKYKARKNDLETYDFVKNSSGYLFGLDCSASVFLAVGSNLPNVSALSYSNSYYSSNEVYMLGGLKLANDEIENYLRENNLIGTDENLTSDVLSHYYGPIIKRKYTKEEIYNSYAELIPGDAVIKRGHARLATGYSNVICNDGTAVQQGNYTRGFCNTHGGIDGEKSYVIITEVGDTYTRLNERAVTGRYVENTNWPVHFNPEYTDVTSLEELLTKKNSFKYNYLYYFSELYVDDDDEEEESLSPGPGLYMPFRFKNMDITTNQIITPKINIITESTYESLKESKALTGTIISNYLIHGIKITINNKTYYIYPNQTNHYSLYYNLSNELKEEFANLDYTKKNIVKVSVKTGSDDERIKNIVKNEYKGYMDEEGYINILNIGNTIEEISFKESLINMVTNKTLKLTPTISPEIKNPNLTWSSSNSNIVTVDQEGNINTLSKGTATITVTTDNNLSASINIIVDDYLKGDINMNNKIDIKDIILLIKKYLKTLEITENDLYLGDINNNNKIDLKDIILLIKTYLNNN